jgi:hypothetical protein
MNEKFILSMSMDQTSIVKVASIQNEKDVKEDQSSIDSIQVSDL